MRMRTWMLVAAGIVTAALVASPGFSKDGEGKRKAPRAVEAGGDREQAREGDRAGVAKRGDR